MCVHFCSYKMEGFHRHHPLAAMSAGGGGVAAMHAHDREI